MPRFFIIFLLTSLYLHAQIHNYSIMPNGQKSGKFMSINILDSKELKFDKFNDIKITEISALAFNDEKLYALSDRGYLYHFDLDIQNNSIKSLKIKKAYKLKNKNNKDLKKDKRDSEGLVFVDNSLLISFETQPRVELFSLNGIKIKNIKIHKDLKNKKSYKNENKALEAVAYSKKYGVITAPEIALKKKDRDYHILYAKDKTWKFLACGNITALEFINKDELLVLERIYDKDTLEGVIYLTKVYLDECKSGICRSIQLAKLDSKKGWRIDNFEGLSKVSKNKYLMVSDDNDSRFQKTLLVLFEIAD